MKKIYIGSKFHGHDSSIFAVLPETKEIFALSTERTTRYKHDYIFPIKPIRKFIEQYEIDVESVQEVNLGCSFTSHQNEIISENLYQEEVISREFMDANYIGDYTFKKSEFSSLGFANKLIKCLATEKGRKFLLNEIFKRFDLQNKVKIDDVIKTILQKIFPNAKIKISYYDHEYCHALSSHYYSNQQSSLIITMDGLGDNNCYSLALVSKGGKIKKISESIAPIRALSIPVNNGKVIEIECSIGGLYNYFTFILGYTVNADEGKVEALAALGSHISEVYEVLVAATNLDDKNLCIKINHSILKNYFSSNTWVKTIKANKREDIAATIQKYTEKIIVQYVRMLIEATGERNISLSGGVFANVIVNLKLFEELADNIYIAPAVGDDGSAQGAAIAMLLNLGFYEKDLIWLAEKKVPYYGTSYTKDSAIRVLGKYSESIYFEDLGEEWPEHIAKRLVAGEIGAIFHGRMEWGPRALGNRSIVADARNPDTKYLINEVIKKREPFQPFCPSILDEEMDRLFESAYPNKHMTCAFRMKRKYWEFLPGAIHVDGTARVQFVSEIDNKNYHKLIKKVKDLTGYGVILNTSFNKHGRTIVESPDDAIKDFLDTNLNYLLIEGLLVLKK